MVSFSVCTFMKVGFNLSQTMLHDKAVQNVKSHMKTKEVVVFNVTMCFDERATWYDM